jgi:Relaxase/Mobilisation nuclease domain
MICKGNLHGDGRELADYLMKEKDGERAELAELRGFESADIYAAFANVETEARATRCRKPFFHGYVRLPWGEQLSRQEWLYCANRIEAKLGFTGQARAVVFHHTASGEAHMHVAWSRIDRWKLRAIDPGLYKNRLKEIARELERVLGLPPVGNEPRPGYKTRSAHRNEFEEARRLGTDLRQIRETIRACWDCSTDGRSFAAALEKEGLTLARGDRRDFVVVDQKGGLHALSKRITGASAKQTRERLADIDRQQLPDIETARVRQQEPHTVPPTCAVISKTVDYRIGMP